MIRYGRVFCDCCGEYMGQVWNEPVIQKNALPLDEAHFCTFACVVNELIEVTQPGSSPILTPVRNQTCSL
jgi:hypothetical protein